MSIMSLSQGAIRTIVGLEKAADMPGFQPFFQVIQVKQVGGQGVQRFRTVLSDGTNFVQGMLSTQLNELAIDNRLTLNCIIQVKNFVKNIIQGHIFMVLLELDVLPNNPGSRIGTPKDIEKESGVNVAASGAPGSNTAPNRPAPPLYGGSNTTTTTTTTSNSNVGNQSRPANNYSNNNNSNNGNIGYVAPSQPTTSNNSVVVNNSNNYVARSNNSPPNSNRYHNGNNKSAGSPSNPYNAQSRGPGVGSAPIIQQRSVQGQPITLISQLNMYQNRWTIKARVVNKSDIRTWSNAKGEGSLFSVELLDKSMDIRATFFKEAVDKFYNQLSTGQVYSFAGGRLKVANVQYNTCKSNFEITFDANAEIRLQDDTGEIQSESYDVTKIADIENLDAGKTVDVIAIVKDVGDVQSLVSKKTGNELQKCDLTLVDDSGAQIRLTLWGNTAINAKQTFSSPNLVGGFRRAKISDYGGKTLSGNTVSVAPQIPEAQALRQWWDSQGHQSGARSLSSSGGSGGGSVGSFTDRKTVSAIRNLNLGYSEKGDYISFRGQFSFIKKDKEGGAWYTACPNADEPCRNRCKVTQTPDGNWTCSRCQGTFPNCTRKWIFSATVADDTGSTWVSVFDDQAMQLFDGLTADAAFQTYDDQDQYDSYFAKAAFSEWIFKCRVRNEVVNDEQRVKTQVVQMEPINYVKESESMLAVLNSY